MAEDVDMTEEQFNLPRFYYIAADSDNEADEVEEVIDEGGPMDFAVNPRFIVDGCSVNAPGDDSDDDPDIYADMPELVSSPDIDRARSDPSSDIEMPQLISVDFDDDEPMDDNIAARGDKYTQAVTDFNGKFSIDAAPAGTAWPGVDVTVVEPLLVLDAIALPATRRSLLPWRRLAR